MPENRDANQRRARREQLQRQRAAEVRKLRLRLLAAALVLLASAAVIIAMSRKGGAAPENGESGPAANISAEAPTEASTESTTAPVRVDQPQSILPNKPTTVIHIAAGGDLVVNYTDEKITLTGDAKLVYTGEAEYGSRLETVEQGCLIFHDRLFS